MIFINKGSLAIKKSFKTAEVGLYYYWASCKGLYKLNCYKSLALVKGEGKANKAYISGVYMDKVYIGKTYTDKAYVDRAYADKAYIDKTAY